MCSAVCWLPDGPSSGDVYDLTTAARQAHWRTFVELSLEGRTTALGSHDHPRKVRSLDKRSNPVEGDLQLGVGRELPLYLAALVLSIRLSPRGPPPNSTA